MAAILSSRRLAYFSTVRNVDSLIFCVRDGDRSDTDAMTATLYTYKRNCLQIEPFLDIKQSKI